MTKKNEKTESASVYDINQNEFITLIERIGLPKTKASKIIGKSKSYISACVYGSGRIKPVFIQRLIADANVGNEMVKIGFEEVLKQREIRNKTIEARAKEKEGTNNV